MSTIPTSDVELWQLCAKRDRLIMWVLYESPADFPGKWVGRFFICDRDPDQRARGTSFCEVGNSRSEVEEAIPYMDRGRWRFMPEFDPAHPQIVGVYT